MEKDGSWVGLHSARCCFLLTTLAPVKSKEKQGSHQNFCSKRLYARLKLQNLEGFVFIRKITSQLRVTKIKAERQGIFKVTTKILQVAPSLHMVEVRKTKAVFSPCSL